MTPFWAYMYWDRLRREAFTESLGDIDRLEKKGLVDEAVAKSARETLIKDLSEGTVRE